MDPRALMGLRGVAAPGTPRISALHSDSETATGT
jgi:hypothetical protein